MIQHNFIFIKAINNYYTRLLHELEELAIFPFSIFCTICVYRHTYNYLLRFYGSSHDVQMNAWPMQLRQSVAAQRGIGAEKTNQREATRVEIQRGRDTQSDVQTLFANSLLLRQPGLRQKLVVNSNTQVYIDRMKYISLIVLRNLFIRTGITIPIVFV